MVFHIIFRSKVNLLNFTIMTESAKIYGGWGGGGDRGGGGWGLGGGFTKQGNIKETRRTELLFFLLNHQCVQ